MAADSAGRGRYARVDRGATSAPVCKFCALHVDHAPICSPEKATSTSRKGTAVLGTCTRRLHRPKGPDQLLNLRALGGQSIPELLVLCFLRFPQGPRFLPLGFRMIVELLPNPEDFRRSLPGS